MKATKTEAGPEYYIFIANSIDWEPHTTGLAIVKTLASQNVWLASRYTPYRKFYEAGDKILFYVAGPSARCFIGDGQIAGPTSEATPKDQALAAKLGLEGFEERIPLHAVTLWRAEVPIKPLVGDLTFIKNKRDYGLHLRQAVARINATDYGLILSHAVKE